MIQQIGECGYRLLSRNHGPFNSYFVSRRMSGAMVVQEGPLMAHIIDPSAPHEDAEAPQAGNKRRNEQIHTDSPIK